MRDPGGSKTCRTRILVHAGQGNRVKVPDTFHGASRDSVAVMAEPIFDCENSLRKQVIGIPVMGRREGGDITLVLLLLTK